MNFPIKFKTREDFFEFLNNFDYDSKRDSELSSVYFLIKNEEYVEPLYFMPFEDVYFESPCELHSCDMTEEELEEYVHEMYQEDSFEQSLEFEKLHLIDGKHYEIDNPQTGPFLKGSFELLDVLSERECLEWILNKRKE